MDPANYYRRARFLLSAARLEQAPPDIGLEVAFAGRSNAGKSSAINALCGQKGLARTSKTPGRTQLLNFFGLDDDHRLVDLPGYGYAAVAASIRAEWQGAVAPYIERRRSLQGLVVLTDIRHPLRDLDLQLVDWASHLGRPVHVLLTKADKLGRGKGSRCSPPCSTTGCSAGKKNPTTLGDKWSGPYLLPAEAPGRADKGGGSARHFATA